MSELWVSSMGLSMSFFWKSEAFFYRSRMEKKWRQKWLRKHARESEHKMRGREREKERDNDRFVKILIPFFSLFNCNKSI